MEPSLRFQDAPLTVSAMGIVNILLTSTVSLSPRLETQEMCDYPKTLLHKNPTESRGGSKCTIMVLGARFVPTLSGSRKPELPVASLASLTKVSRVALF